MALFRGARGDAILHAANFHADDDRRQSYSLGAAIYTNEATTKHIAAFKDSMIPKLTELVVTKLAVNYSGSGDEGSIDEIDVEPEGLALCLDLEEQINDLADKLLYSERGRWKNGDGTTGMIVIDAVAGTIVSEHGWYFTDVNYETEEF